MSHWQNTYQFIFSKISQGCSLVEFNFKGLESSNFVFLIRSSNRSQNTILFCRHIRTFFLIKYFLSCICSCVQMCVSSQMSTLVCVHMEGSGQGQTVLLITLYLASWGRVFHWNCFVYVACCWKGSLSATCARGPSCKNGLNTGGLPHLPAICVGTRYTKFGPPEWYRCLHTWAPSWTL